MPARVPSALEPTPAPERAPEQALTHEAVRADLRPIEPAPARRFYLRVRTRFVISVLAGLAWVGISTWIALRWIRELGETLTLPVAILVIVGIAIIPGYLNVQLLMSIVLDRPRPLRYNRPPPRIALLVAAYNEANAIEETLTYALRSDYDGSLEVVVADDGSTDGTQDIVRRVAASDPRVRLVESPHGGKAKALNAALATVETPFVATIDADTLLMPQSLRRAVARMLESPPDTVAVAGSVLARNSRANFLTRMQEWDYFLAIASVKRQQALLQGTLVAQGAFSVYKTDALRRVGGWPDRIGEDIVLTWSMMRDGGRCGFEPTAIAFTEVPEQLRHFLRQRQRWARGMIEGLRDHGSELVGRRRFYAHSIGVNYVFPFLDAAYTLAFLPGVVLAATGNFMLVGPMTIAVLPINVLIASVMLHRQRQVFREVGFRVRRNIGGFFAYLLAYAPIMSPVSFIGYVKELRRAERRWK
jgi:biofilm PGA synthesis N-glycosyltransferase PgaC